MSPSDHSNSATVRRLRGSNEMTDYVVKDLGLAAYGRKEIAIAETEMAGLMACRAEFGEARPLAGALGELSAAFSEVSFSFSPMDDSLEADEGGE